MPIMQGYMIAFHLPTGIPNRVYTKFQKRFYGQDTSSHGGKYRYRRAGILDNIPYRRLIRGVIVIREEDLDVIVAFLHEYNAEVHVRKIELLNADIEHLSVERD